jgi:RND superfamily putative drug exporter
MFERLGRLAQRRAVWVILGWFAAAGALQILAPSIRSVVTSDVTAFLTKDSQSVRATQVLARDWPRDDFSDSAAVVFTRDGGLQRGDVSYIGDLESWMRSPAAPRVVTGTISAQSRPDFADELVAPDGTQLVIVQFSTPPFEPPTNNAVVAIRDHIASTKPAGLVANVTGNAGVGADQANGIDESVKRTTAITLLLVVLILLYVYRSPVTVLVPLATIGVAFLVSSGVIALLAQAGMKTSSLVENFLVVIVFGAGTDYCLFIISRFREEVGHTREYVRTLVGTVAIVGAVIASSASTVIVGFSAQGVARFGMFRTTGPALAVAVAITLLAGLTLTPALMRLLGRWLFWPAHPERLAAAGALPEHNIDVGITGEPVRDARGRSR